MNGKNRSRGPLRLVLAGLLASAAGCFTTYETEFPQTTIVRAPAGKDVKVRVSGFAAQITEYVAIHGYGAMYDGWYGCGPWARPAYRTVHTETLVPQTHTSDVFLKQATSFLEENGYILKAPTPDWLVEVEFSPAAWDTDDESVRAIWMLCSILSCDYGSQTRTAKLKIYDNRTGRLVHHADFSQRYQVTMWSPIPIFGPASYDRTGFNYKQSWCLTALTRKCVEEATRFLSAQ